MALDSEKGQRFLLTLHNLLRTVLIYDDANRLSIESAENFSKAALEVFREGYDEFTVQVSHGRFFIADEKITYGRNMASLIQVMLDYFEKRRISGFTFYSLLEKADRNEILHFARTLSRAGDKEDPAGWLKTELGAKGLSWVELFEPIEESCDPQDDAGEEEPADHAEEVARRDRARRVYSYGLSNLKEVARKLGSGSRAGISKSVRMVQNMVNILDEDEPLLVGLSTLRVYDDDTFSHSVNVALLSMCIGKRIGLSRSALEKLGLSAMFHDLGKVSIPSTITKKPEKLTNREWLIMRSHPLHSVRQIVMLRAPHNRKAQLVLPAFEHHMKFDLSGYPKASNWQPSLFGRIITIADVFDAITTPRIYRHTFLSPDRALGYMIQKSGKDFDPILLKVFINLVGFYPPGTIVELDSGEKGLVIDTPAENHASGLPRAQILVPDDGDGYRKGEIVNLADQSPETGQYLRKIVDTAHPAAYNIQPAQFFF